MDGWVAPLADALKKIYKSEGTNSQWVVFRNLAGYMSGYILNCRMARRA
jgi:hypothetical protein